MHYHDVKTVVMMILEVSGCHSYCKQGLHPEVKCKSGKVETHHISGKTYQEVIDKLRELTFNETICQRDGTDTDTGTGTFLSMFVQKLATTWPGRGFQKLAAQLEQVKDEQPVSGAKQARVLMDKSIRDLWEGYLSVLGHTYTI